MSYGKTQIKLDSTGSSDAIILTASSTNTLTVTTGGSNPVVSGIHTLNVTNGININSVAVATQDYVNDTVQGRLWLSPVRVATTANVNLTSDISNGDTIDGVVLATNDRILVKHQTTPIDNGIYVVQVGAAVRASDMAASASAVYSAVLVSEGTSNGDKAFLCTNNAGLGTVETDDLVFTQFGGSDVADGSITTAKLAAGAVTNAKVADNAIDTINIIDSAVTMDKIANGSIDNSKIQDGQVNNDKLATDSVTTIKIAAANVTAAKLASDAVTTAKILDANVTTAKIADANVTTGKLADNAVTTIKITDANVTTGKLADNAVTTVKITDANVTTGKLADNAVTTVKITDANVTTDKIADANVTAAKLASDAVTTVKILDANVTTGKLADNAVTTVKITDANVTTGKLADNAVTTVKITDANVTTAKIADSNVTAAKLASDAVTTVKILDANVTTAKILDANVTTAKVADGAVTGAKLNSNVVGINMVYNSSTSKLDAIRRVFDPVRCVATTNVVHTTALENGDTLDGLTLATGDRVLLANQNTPSLNGIYVVVGTGAGAAGRAVDMFGGRSDQLSVHSTVFVTSGTVGAGTTWRVSATNGTPTGILVGTDTTTWLRVEAPVLAASIAPGTFTSGTYSFASSTITNLGTVTTANIDGGTIDGATIATSNITVGSGKALTVSGGGTLTTNSLTATGNLDIGSFTLSASSFLATSDRDSKTNIATMRADYALDCVRQMKGVKFDWKSNGEPSVGVIAQDMQEITPELVGRNPEGKLSFNYDGLNGYLIPAIQYLAEKCEALEEEVDKLKRKRSRAMMSDSTEGDDEEGDQPLKAQPRLE